VYKPLLLENPAIVPRSKPIAVHGAAIVLGTKPLAVQGEAIVPGAKPLPLQGAGIVPGAKLFALQGEAIVPGAKPLALEGAAIGRYSPRPSSSLVSGAVRRDAGVAMKKLFALMAVAVVLAAGGIPAANGQPAAMPFDGSATFGQDVAFLSAYTYIYLLEDLNTHAKVAVAPAWQGRVMTSTTGGDDGTSFGWIHYGSVAAAHLPAATGRGAIRPVPVLGGEERVWLGPEGGQFGLFFPPPPAQYNYANWRIPALLDTQSWEVIAGDGTTLEMRGDAVLVNRSGVPMQVGISRELRLMDRPTMSQVLGSEVPQSLPCVGYWSRQILTNLGDAAWIPERGMISIWMLGMFKPGPDVIMVMPFKPGGGPAVSTD
jgi:hypothetical protein